MSFPLGLPTCSRAQKKIAFSAFKSFPSSAMAVTISAVERLAACGVAPGKIAWKNKQGGRERYQHSGITTMVHAIWNGRQMHR